MSILSLLKQKNRIPALIWIQTAITFVAFVILSVMGLGLNEVIMLFCMEVVYANWNWITTFLSHKMAVAGSKVFATGIVMVFNFVTRKIFLEQKDC